MSRIGTHIRTTLAAGLLIACTPEVTSVDPVLPR
jgi:hypothetical protein